MTNFADIEMFGELTFAQEVARLPKVFQQRMKRLYTRHENFRGLTAICHLLECKAAIAIAYTLKSQKRIDAVMNDENAPEHDLLPNLDVTIGGFLRACQIAKQYLRKSKSVQ